MLATAILFLTLDFTYLQVIAPLFRKQIEKVQKSPMQINLFGAALCYIFLLFGLLYFIVRPGRSVMDAFLLGLVIYGVYETTNYALLKDWALMTVLIDTLWGGVLFAATTYLVTLMRKMMA